MFSVSHVTFMKKFHISKGKIFSQNAIFGFYILEIDNTVHNLFDTTLDTQTYYNAEKQQQKIVSRPVLIGVFITWLRVRIIIIHIIARLRILIQQQTLTIQHPTTMYIYMPEQ